MATPSHWPIASAIIFCRLVSIGPSCAEQLPNEVLAWAHNLIKLLLADNPEYAHYRLRAPMATPSHWPIASAIIFGQLISIGPSCAEQLPNEVLAWACNVNKLPFADELERAHCRLRAPLAKPSHGPIAGTIIFSR
jgi:hypothetical protein